MREMSCGRFINAVAAAVCRDTLYSDRASTQIGVSERRRKGRRMLLALLAPAVLVRGGGDQVPIDYGGDTHSSELLILSWVMDG